MKQQSFNLSLIKELTLYTGSNGKRGCSCNCPGCSQTNYGLRKAKVSHQGTLQQIQQIINLLPNLEKAYFLGNPDCSVDTEFCSAAAKLFIDNKIHVMFSTSGIGGKYMIKKLLENLDLDFVDYISFSIDSVDETKESILKGRKIDYQLILEGIEYCKSINVPVKIQPTIWKLNEKCWLDIIDFFSSFYNINWFTFHVGSQEGFYPQTPSHCQHVSPESWYDTSHSILEFAAKFNFNVVVPLIFLTPIEFKDYKKNYIPHCVNPNPTNIQIWMEDTLRSTFFPILSNISPNKFIDNFEQNIVSNQIDIQNHQCIAQKFSLGKELASEFNKNLWEKDGLKLFYACRYYKQIINH